MKKFFARYYINKFLYIFEYIYKKLIFILLKLSLYNKIILIKMSNSTNTTSGKISHINVKTKVYNKAEGFVTLTKYNNSGSLLYIGDNNSKKINVINTKTWKIVGSYIGHNGVVWDLDFSSNDEIMVSGSGDLMLGIWGAKTGELYKMFEPLNFMSVPEKFSIQKNTSTNYLIVYCKSKSKKNLSRLNFYDLDKAKDCDILDTKFILKSVEWKEQTEITSIKWLNDSKYIIGTFDGRIIIKDFLDEEFIQQASIHTGAIKTIVFNENKTNILTSSIDGSAKEINISTFEIVGEYKSPVQINSAIYSARDRLIITGGGREAMDVAKSTINDLSIKIFRKKDKKFVKEINSHFGPVRCLHSEPNSKNFVSGGHDGIAKIYILDGVEEGGVEEGGVEEGEVEDETEEIVDIKSTETFDMINSTKFLGIQNVVGKYLIDDETKFEYVIANKPNPQSKQNIIPGDKNFKSNSSGDDLFTFDSRDFLAETVERRKKRMQEEDLFLIKTGYENKNDDDDDNHVFRPFENLTPGAVKVTNLPIEMDYYELKNILEGLFDSFGRVSRIGFDRKITYDRIAYVNYTDINNAHKAIEFYNKKENQQRMGHQIMSVELANIRN